MTVEEFHEMYSRPMEIIKTEHIKELEVRDTIVNTDWREVPGILTHIKDQHTCGNCYSFASAAAVESAWALSGKGLHSLSVQQITDCSIDFGNNGCNGGFYPSTYEYIKKYGLVSQEYYPFVNSVGYCKKSITEYPLVTIESYDIVKPNSTEALMQAVMQQPVSVLIDDTAMLHYTGGIITSGCGLATNHAVVIVGFNLDDEQQSGYWIVRNSWGTSVGYKGYFYVSIVDGPGVCGIQQVG
eukprot:CAMPEP_0202946488 /NCGR_PEP_ID=MMETSP1395-20130829/9275_1 /ASSEMBLY_ACC=CAM_ASM_000871 /TAXON_ID=5961 /ORGANISM="Blepharisma japonicum, Strain Stock R1072" /LENGTH=240 /DNA_ID=CAMNT_0049647125 /DNA_START=315 /DNA_END=1033 /DNA_ORIENTATION=-